jgi:hypothetical protein
LEVELVRRRPKPEACWRLPERLAHPHAPGGSSGAAVDGGDRRGVDWSNELGRNGDRRGGGGRRQVRAAPGATGGSMCAAVANIDP